MVSSQRSFHFLPPFFPALAGFPIGLVFPAPPFLPLAGLALTALAFFALGALTTFATFAGDLTAFTALPFPFLTGVVALTAAGVAATGVATTAGATATATGAGVGVDFPALPFAAFLGALAAGALFLD